MPREARSFEHLIGRVKGLGEKQLRNHFTLYQGYVKKLNEIEERLAAADRGAANYSYSEYGELRRREPVAFNGALLHELYFENLTAPGQETTAPLRAAAEDAFGSWDAWIADVRAMVLAAHGWALATYNLSDGRLRNVLVQSEHHVGLQVNSVVLLAVDAWEHAYFLDYGTAKADYFANIVQSLAWDVVDARLRAAPLAPKK